MRSLPGATLVFALATAPFWALVGCSTNAVANPADEATFPIGSKNLAPNSIVDIPMDASPLEVDKMTFFRQDLQVAVGEASTEPIQQPIAFPHSLHAGTLGMDCQYCHSASRKGIHAGVPPTQLCMGCHANIESKDRPELEKLKAFWADGKGDPIPWVKVHDLPDFVYFNHKRHVLGGVQCQECHGQVQEMGVAQRVASLKMGWCLDCHAQHELDKSYGTQAELRRSELKDCWTCHK